VTTAYLTIVGRFEDSDDTTVAVVAAVDADADPHLAALRHVAKLSAEGVFSVVAVLRGRCPALVTRQSLRLYSERLLAK